MKCSSLLKKVAVATVAATSLIGMGATGQASASTSAWIDTSDRAAVVAAYDKEFSKVTPAIGWTGDRASCNAGTTSSAYRQSVVDRLNYFRAMAGVPTGVVENTTWSAQAQQAALSMSATGRLSHDPDGSFTCFSSTVDSSAGASNLYLGRTGPDAITGYVDDPGAGNVSVGHRSWIFHSTLQEVGVGDLPSSSTHYSANTLQVIDSNRAFSAEPVLRESDGFVAWPTRGYNPGELVFPRWSFTLRGATFESAQVTVVRNGQTLANSIVHRSTKANSAPFPNIVWEPAGVDTSPSVDQVYTVTVSNVSVGAQKRTYSYDVIILGDAPGAASATTPADNRGYITAAFSDFLGRQPTSSELETWNSKLRSGTTRQSFVAELASSEEWTKHVVDELYQNTLGRTGDAAGRDYWSSQLQAGVPVARVAASFYGSPEYVARQGGTYGQWVDELYGVLLSRTADSTGQQFWSGQANVVGSHSVAFEFYQSFESRQARVVELYNTLLSRDPDPAGRDYWANVLSSGNDLELAGLLASSDEYFARS